MRIPLFALAAWFGLAGTAFAEVSFGLAKDDAWPSSQHIELMEQHGLTDHGVVYYTLTSEENLANPFDWVRLNYLDAGIPVVLTLIIDDRTESAVTTVGTSEGTDISAGVPGLLLRVVTGDFDEPLRELAAEIAADGRPIVVRPFHELDGGWYQWGIYADGNTPEMAVAAVEHVIDVFDAAGADNISWEINFNRRDGQGEVLGAAEYLLPRLDRMVDAYSVSTYNRCGTSDRYPTERSFADDFAPIYERITALSDLPVNLAEVSTSGLCAPRLPWFEAMVESLPVRFPRTEMVTFFFGTVPVGRASNDVPIYWGFDQEPELLPDFRELIESTRDSHTESRAAPIQAPPPPRRAASMTGPLEGRAPDDAAPGNSSTAVSTASTVFGFDSMPWSVWGRFSYPLHEEGNPALNPVTGNTFGESGPVFRFTATQRFLWDLGDIEHGPGFTLGGALSSNDDQWWNNHVTAGLTYGFYGDFPRGSVLWGGWSAELFVGHREYFAPTPDRLDDGDEVIELRFGVNFGGDWLR